MSRPYLVSTHVVAKKIIFIQLIHKQLWNTNICLCTLVFTVHVSRRDSKLVFKKSYSQLDSFLLCDGCSTFCFSHIYKKKFQHCVCHEEKKIYLSLLCHEGSQTCFGGIIKKFILNSTLSFCVMGVPHFVSVIYIKNS